MNGRMYDFNNGRFLSVDPFIQGTTSQAINPYSYIQNNPLSGVDPTGYLTSHLDDGGCGIADNRCGKSVNPVGSGAYWQEYAGVDNGAYRFGSVTLGSLCGPAGSCGDLSDTGSQTTVNRAANNIAFGTGIYSFVQFGDGGEDFRHPMLRYTQTKRKVEEASEHFSEDITSGRARDRIQQALKAEVSVLAGGLEIVLGYNPISGPVGGVFLGAHGVGNVSGGIGDYLNIFDGGSRDANITRRVYENLSVLAGGSKESGAIAFYTVDFAMGVGALATPIKVRVDSGSFSSRVPQIVGGHARVSTLRASGGVGALRDAVILGDTINSTVNNSNDKEREKQ